jgi:hypothetical protein
MDAHGCLQYLDSLMDMEKAHMAALLHTAQLLPAETALLKQERFAIQIHNLVLSEDILEHKHAMRNAQDGILAHQHNTAETE